MDSKQKKIAVAAAATVAAGAAGYYYYNKYYKVRKTTLWSQLASLCARLLTNDLNSFPVRRRHAGSFSPQT